MGVEVFLRSLPKDPLLSAQGLVALPLGKVRPVLRQEGSSVGAGGLGRPRLQRRHLVSASVPGILPVSVLSVTRVPVIALKSPDPSLASPHLDDARRDPRPGPHSRV